MVEDPDDPAVRVLEFRQVIARIVGRVLFHPGIVVALVGDVPRTPAFQRADRTEHGDPAGRVVLDILLPKFALRIEQQPGRVTNADERFAAVRDPGLGIGGVQFQDAGQVRTRRSEGPGFPV